MSKYILKDKPLENAINAAIKKSTPQQRMSLTPREALYCVRPKTLITNRNLDEKIMFLTKLGQKVWILFHDETADGKTKDIAAMFNGTFVSKERNNEAIEIFHNCNFALIGGDTIERQYHKAEMFIHSDMYELASSFKTWNSKKIQRNFQTITGKHDAAAENLTDNVLKLFIAANEVKPYLESVGLTPDQFSMLAYLYVKRVPQTMSQLSERMRNFIGNEFKKVGALKRLVTLGYMETIKLIENGKKKRRHTEALTHEGREVVQIIFKKMMEEINK